MELRLALYELRLALREASAAEAEEALEDLVASTAATDEVKEATAGPKNSPSNYQR